MVLTIAMASTLNKKERNQLLRRVKKCIQEARKLSKTFKGYIPDYLLASAIYNWQTNNKNRALELFKECFIVAEKLERKLILANSYYEIGHYLLGDPKPIAPGGRSYLKKSLSLYEELGLTVYVSRLQKILKKQI